jgi:hypothetical protein
MYYGKLCGGSEESIEDVIPDTTQPEKAASPVEPKKEDK